MARTQHYFFLKVIPKYAGKFGKSPNFWDEVVRQFGTEYATEVVGVFGDEFIPKFGDKCRDSPNFGTNFWAFFW